MSEYRGVRWGVRGVVALVVAGVLVYPGDWVVWVVRGRPVGTVTVSFVTAETLKGNKVGYEADGTGDVTCSRSLFQQAGSGACWKLEEHPEVVTQY